MWFVFIGGMYCIGDFVEVVDFGGDYCGGMFLFGCRCW